MLRKKLKELREANGLVHRQVAIEREVDSAHISKVKNEEKHLSKAYLNKIARVLKIKETELHKLWLSGKILALIKNEPTSKDSLKITIKKL